MELTQNFTNILQNFQNINNNSFTLTIISVILMPILGLILRQSLTMSNQTWAKTYHHTLSFTLLPLITFFITRAIAGNIVLALGMVGALSIVRFRTPVRNPLELIMYFASISIGIVGSVNIVYAIIMLIFICIILIFFKKVEMISKKYNNDLFSLSFTEGEALNFIELSLEKEDSSLQQSEFLVQEFIDNENKIYSYKFASNNKKNLNYFINEYKSVNSNLIKNINKSFV